MSHDTNDTIGVGPRATIQLRTERFALMTQVLGCGSDADRARLLGLTERTIIRARQGVIGEKFIAHTISAMRRREMTLREHGVEPTFDGVFHVIDQAA